MRSGIHLPTAVLTAGTLIVVWALLLLRSRSRSRSRGFLSATDRATYETLHTASLAGRQLRHGLGPESAREAAGYLRSMLTARAIAICDTHAVLAWDGEGEHHRPRAHSDAQPALRGAGTTVLDQRDVACNDPNCELLSAVVAPLVVDEHVVGALTAYGPHTDAGLARATEEVAQWVAAQVELADLDQQRTRAMEAELQALRAQISPHFVYNSLAAIASFVRTDPGRARELLLEFADFTRYALRRAGQFTTLAEELRNCERYLVLEQARFGDRLKINLLIAPESLPTTVPCLAVQPLVENAVRHGLAGKVGPGTVTITARDIGAQTEISIEDDGVGANPEHIRGVLDGEVRSDSVGLGNVDARLRQIYGDDLGLVVETAPGAGMKVTFTVPKYAPGVHVSS
ncbi:MAG: histidine kinase [Micrococcales bacterium]|nr:histidine kinase [Micrococcales bacterium]